MDLWKSSRAANVLNPWAISPAQNGYSGFTTFCNWMGQGICVDHSTVAYLKFPIPLLLLPIQRTLLHSALFLLNLRGNKPRAWPQNILSPSLCVAYLHPVGKPPQPGLDIQGSKKSGPSLEPARPGCRS